MFRIRWASLRASSNATARQAPTPGGSPGGPDLVAIEGPEICDACDACTARRCRRPGSARTTRITCGSCPTNELTRARRCATLIYMMFQRAGTMLLVIGGLVG